MMVLSGWWQKRRNIAAVRFRRGPNGFCPRYRQIFPDRLCRWQAVCRKKRDCTANTRLHVHNRNKQSFSNLALLRCVLKLALCVDGL